MSKHDDDTGPLFEARNLAFRAIDMNEQPRMCARMADPTFPDTYAYLAPAECMELGGMLIGWAMAIQAQQSGSVRGRLIVFAPNVPLMHELSALITKHGGRMTTLD